MHHHSTLRSQSWSHVKIWLSLERGTTFYCNSGRVGDRRWPPNLNIFWSPFPRRANSAIAELRSRCSETPFFAKSKEVRHRNQLCDRRVDCMSKFGSRSSLEPVLMAISASQSCRRVATLRSQSCILLCYVSYLIVFDGI